MPLYLPPITNGGTITGPLILSGANLTIAKSPQTAAYRFRQDGSNLDQEAGGADWFFSVWSGADFTGTQRNYFRAESGAQILHVIGRVDFVTSPFAGATHQIDASGNASFAGLTAQGLNSQSNIRLGGRLTTYGAPTSGTWTTGDVVMDANSQLWYCTAGGTPGTWTAYYASMVLDRLTTPVDVVNTTVETTLFTSSVPANVMSTNRKLRLELSGDYLNNTGSTLTTSETLRIKFGATTMFSDLGKNHAPSSNRKPWALRIGVMNLGATNSQGLSGTMTLGGSPAATGIGEYSDDEIDCQTALGGTAAEDTTAAKSLVVTIQHGQADANISYRCQSGTLEVV